MAAEGSVTAGGLQASAPPESSIYPVLSQPGGGAQPMQSQYQPQQIQQQQYQQIQQPQSQSMPAQQAMYANPQQIESQQLYNDISIKFDQVINKLTDTKTSILTQCQTANNEQKKDILEQLQHIFNGIDEVKIDPNIKPKKVEAPPQIQQQIQPQIQQQVQPQIVVVQQQPIQQNIKYISDTWNTKIANNLLQFNLNNNSVTRIGKRGEWLNAFGNQIVTKGQYKRWEVKIIPKFVAKKQKDYIADVVIGIVNCQKLNNTFGGFWLGPMLGYGYYGYNGKKFHTKRQGKNYAAKFNINDQISIEVNMQQFEMGFYVNNVYQGKAFPIDARLSYCLAVSLCSPDYDIQIV